MRIQLIAVLSNRKFMPVSLQWGCTLVLEYSLPLYLCIYMYVYRHVYNRRVVPTNTSSEHDS